MKNYGNQDSSAITFADAIETLTHLADLKIEVPPATDSAEASQRIGPLQGQDVGTTIEMAKNSFRVILNYFQKFYHKESGYLTDTGTIERIKTIMALVGEAAKKLDRYTQILEGTHGESVTELQEYRQLQEFYRRKIARKIDEGTLGAWILQLTQNGPEAPSTDVKVPATRAKKRTFIDLEGIKKDQEYDLFFLRKEDGTRYYSPRMVRNIRLVCDFGEYFGEIKHEDPLEGVHLWRDRVLQASAAGILHACRSATNEYFQQAARHKEEDLVHWMNKALIALMLSACPQNLITRNPLKTCTEYFRDFQFFLRGALTCRDYQKLVIYPPKKSNRMRGAMLRLIHALCTGLYHPTSIYAVLTPVVAELMEKNSKELTEPPSSWWEKLEREAALLRQNLKYHPNRPLRQILEILEEGGAAEFDPLQQLNIPTCWFHVQLQDSSIPNLRMASPTRQEYIHKAFVNEEFKEWIRQRGEEKSESPQCLLINLQDNTSWREHARCRALEELQHKSDYEKNLVVVTLATNTDFYHQSGLYQRINEADLFIQSFKEQLLNKGCGFYFPSPLKEALNPLFLDQLFATTHQLFFSFRNVLSHKERQAFIQIVYLFLMFKMMDVIGPRAISLVCKDGVDTSSTLNGLLFAAPLIFNPQVASREAIEKLQLILHSSALLMRERMVQSEPLQRLFQTIRTLAVASADLGQDKLREGLNPLFKKAWWMGLVA